MSGITRCTWLRVTVVALGCAAFTSGCKNGDASTDLAAVLAIAPAAPVITSFGGVIPVNVMATVRVTTTTSVAGYPVSVDANFAVARFGGIGAGTDKGTVTVTALGTPYTLTRNGTADITYTYTPSASAPGGIGLNAGSTATTWSVSGLTLASASVNAPGQLVLVTPSANATVSRTSALTVTWSTGSGPAANSAVFISDAAGHTVFKQGLGAVSSGSFTVGELGTLSAGTGFVYAITYNYLLTNSNTAVLVGEAVALATITLQ